MVGEEGVKPIRLALFVGACVIGFAISVSAETIVEPAVTPHFSHGPILGRPSADSIGVWARTSQPTSFLVRYGLSETALEQSSSFTATHLERDNTAWIELPNLSPSTRYYYQLTMVQNPDVTSEVFSFETLPSSEEHVGNLNPKGLFNFSFSATSCAKQSPVQGQGNQPQATLVREAASEVNFHVALGDWLYEKDRLHSAAQWFESSSGPGANFPKLVNDVPTIPGAWENYKSYLNDENLSEWHASVPSMFLFDDHEVLNNFQDSTVVGHVGRNALFRDPGLRAWRNYLGWANPEPDSSTIKFGRSRLNANISELHDPDADFSNVDFGPENTLHIHWGGPFAGFRNTDANNRSQIDASIDSAGPVDPNAGVYRVTSVIDKHTLEISPRPTHDSASSYSIGGLKYFFGWQVANVEVIGLDTRSRRQSTLSSNSPTILGETQLEWLAQRIRESNADFVFLLSSVSMMIPHVSGAPPNVDDQSWSGYPKERAALLEMLEASGKTVMIVTGDLHNAYSIRLSDRVWEFAVGPIGALNRTVGKQEGDLVGANGFIQRGSLDAEIRWGTWYHDETPTRDRRTPVYTIFQVNNVLDSPDAEGRTRWIAYERPQVVVQFYHANTGQLLYAESVLHQVQDND